MLQDGRTIGVIDGRIYYGCQTSRFEPILLKVEERNDEDREKEGAVHAWPLEDVGGREEEQEIERRRTATA